MLSKTIAALALPALALAQANYTVTVEPTVTEIVTCSTSSSVVNGVLQAVKTIDITSTITLCGCEDDTIVASSAAPATAAPVAVTSSPAAVAPVAATSAASVTSVVPVAPAASAASVSVAAAAASSDDTVTYVTVVQGQLVTVYGSLASSTAVAASNSSNSSASGVLAVEASNQAKLQVNLFAAVGTMAVIAGALLM